MSRRRHTRPSRSSASSVKARYYRCKFRDDYPGGTCAVLAGASEPDPRLKQREDEIRECDRKLTRYRALLDEDGDVAIAAQWISETQRNRRTLEAQLGEHLPGGEMTTKQVKALICALCDIVDVLAEADPTAKAEVYNDLGLKLDYSPTGTVSVEARPRGVIVGVGGGT
ncbi:MAG: hypothetical protein ABIP03_07455 [Aquihabitans sp.]